MIEDSQPSSGEGDVVRCTIFKRAEGEGRGKKERAAIGSAVRQ
jgi:hypothetical protein